MKLVVGLGNPDIKYINTRHNTGFRVIDNLLDKYNLKLDKSKFNGVYCKTNIENTDVIVAKPLTYMNNSGEFIKPLIDYYKINVKDIIVIYDELALNEDRIKVSFGGSSAGHNGIKSVINMLKNENFIRLRIGIGPVPSYIKIIDFVLMNYSLDEIKQKKEVYNNATLIIEDLLINDVSKVMNKYNKYV